MHNKILNKYYFINKFNQSHIDKQDKETTIIYRNYNQTTDKKLILKLKDYCKGKGSKFLLSNNIKLAINLDLDGAYIPSFNINLSHLSFSYKKNFVLLGSAHNIYEIRTKELQKVNAIFLSPLFKVNKNKSFLNPLKFNFLASTTKIKVIALGGINRLNVKKLKLVRASGFAGISYFEDNNKAQNNVKQFRK